MVPDKGYGTSVPFVNRDGGSPTKAKAQRADARRNREAIVRAADDAFASGGPTVSMDEIAGAAGVGVGTLYRHFPTKEALFVAVVGHHLALLSEEVEALRDAADPGAAFYDLLGRMVQEATDKRDLLDALSRAGIDPSDGAADVKERLHEAVGALFARAKLAGAVRDDLTVDELLSLLMGACTAMCHVGADRAARSRMMAVIFDGLRPHTAPGGTPATGS